jgi:hypothetical protein
MTANVRYERSDFVQRVHYRGVADAELFGPPAYLVVIRRIDSIRSTVFIAMLCCHGVSLASRDGALRDVQAAGRYTPASIRPQRKESVKWK